MRTSALDVPLRLMDELIAQGYPVFFTGDHNEPSSLDWTEATAAARPDVEEAVAWPVSEAILELGFRDTYRDIHPNPVEVPGITHEGAGDRIDYLYAAGPLATLDSQLVGEEGGRGVEVGFEPWTSDHRAVVSTFDVTPVPMPVMVSVNAALLTQGDPLTVAYRSPRPEGSRRDRAVGRNHGLAGADPGRHGKLGNVRRRHVGPRTRRLRRASWSGGDGSEVARVTFWVATRTRRSRSRPTGDLRGGGADRRELDGRPGQPLGLDRCLRGGEGGPEGRLLPDVELRRPARGGTVPPSVSGSMTLDETAMGNPWPLPPGRYVVHYLVTDRYRSIGSASFEVNR